MVPTPRVQMQRARLVAHGIGAEALQPEWCLQNGNACSIRPTGAGGEGAPAVGGDGSAEAASAATAAAAADAALAAAQARQPHRRRNGSV